MPAPPSSRGAVILRVAVPANPMATDLIDGATGGPSGRCHCVPTCEAKLQELRVRIIWVDEPLLMQVLRFNSCEPGVPAGADPALYQVLVS